MTVRATGAVDHGRGFGVHDHVCWRYDDTAEFRARAIEFLVDGVLAGQRVLYVGPATPDALLADLRGNPVLTEALAYGTATVADVTATYPGGVAVDPFTQAAAYAEATEQAVTDGFTGFRVAADATSLVRTPAQAETFARYEHLVDRYTAHRPFAAMCAYDRAELGDELVADLACMHSAASRGATGFRLSGTARPGCVAAVGGEIDLVEAAGWRRALDRADLHPVIGDEILLDATELTFIDHHGLVALADAGFDRGAPVVLLDGPRAAGRVIELLDIPHVTVAAVHGSSAYGTS